MWERWRRRRDAGHGETTVPLSVETAVAPLAPAASQALNEGVQLYQDGRLEAAALALERAIACRHDLAEAHFFLGLVHKKRGSLEDAVDSLLLATTFRAKYADAWFQLGAIELALGRTGDAERSFNAALAGEPGHAGARAACAKLCEDRKQFSAALAHWQAVIAVQPDHAIGYCNLGRLTLRVSLDDAEALRYVRQALALAPGLAEAHSCHAQILQFQGRCREAIAAADHALQLDPAAAHTRMIRALARLSLGEFAAGWPDYEERKRVYPVYAQRKLPYPEWDGTALAGKRLLVYHEQGLGDEIMFASCLPDVLRTGAHCVIECSARLQPLFARSFPAATVVAADQTSPDLSHLRALPACDRQVAAGSLPRFFRRTIDDFSAVRPYLCAEPAALSRWRTQLQALGAGINIGLSWRGGVQQTNRSNRSISPELLRPLLTTAGCNFVSLQYGEQSDDLATMQDATGARVHCLNSALASIDETAALAAALDLVISVDTTVAHLAAALGTPVWVLVPPNAEWRYMTAGTRMPWYPAMRIFRRGHDDGGWAPVLAQLVAELAAGHVKPRLQ
jgi:tetratricopeptide (TPR) repeat protein